MDIVQRLVMMTRGIADPLAFAYCHLYMAHCAQKLPQHDIGMQNFQMLCCKLRSILVYNLMVILYIYSDQVGPSNVVIKTKKLG